MSPRPIPLDWDALETAVERNAPDTESFLDRTTGQVLTVVSGDPEAPIRKRQIAENISNFVRVEPASSREQYRWMERFVSSVADPALRERLIISIDGKGAFRRFKDVLLAYPAERERWFSYRADLLHWHIFNWLKEAQIDAAEPPPWGEAKPPPELPLVEGQAGRARHRGAGRGASPTGARAHRRHRRDRSAERHRVPRVPARSLRPADRRPADASAAEPDLGDDDEPVTLTESKGTRSAARAANLRASGDA